MAPVPRCWLAQARLNLVFTLPIALLWASLQLGAQPHLFGAVFRGTDAIGGLGLWRQYRGKDAIGGLGLWHQYPRIGPPRDDALNLPV